MEYKLPKFERKQQGSRDQKSRSTKKNRRITIDLNFGSEKIWSQNKRHQSNLDTRNRPNQNANAHGGITRGTAATQLSKQPVAWRRGSQAMGTEKPPVRRNHQIQILTRKHRKMDQNPQKQNSRNERQEKSNGEHTTSIRKIVKPEMAEQKEDQSSTNPNAKIDMVLSILESQNELTSGPKQGKRISNYLKTKYHLKKMHNSKTFFSKKPAWTTKKGHSRGQPTNDRSTDKHFEQNAKGSRGESGQGWPRMQNSRVLSHVNKNIFPENRSFKMQKKYSHKIITRNREHPIIRNISEVGPDRRLATRARAETSGNKRYLQTPFKMSNSKSQNQLIPMSRGKPRAMKKSNSTMVIKSSKKNQFTFSKNQAPASRFGRPEQRDSHVPSEAVRKDSFGLGKSVSRSKSRKINLADYTVTRLNKSNKSLQRHRVFEESSRTAQQLFAGLRPAQKSHFPSLQQNLIEDEYNPERRSKSPKYVSRLLEPETNNLKSDYLESSVSQLTRSHSASNIGKSQSKRFGNEPAIVRVISTFNINAKRAEGLDGSSTKRSQSTNLTPKYVQHVFKDSRKTSDFSRFGVSDQIKLNSGWKDKVRS